MALDLNKGGEENSKTTTEKKGLNLSKSGDSINGVFNLSKNSQQSDAKLTSLPIQNNGKKKSTFIFVFAAVLILGAGSFWFMNQKENSIHEPEVSNQIPTPANPDVVTSTPGIESQQTLLPIDDANNSQVSTEEVASVSTGNREDNSTANSGNSNTNNPANETQNTTNSASSSGPKSQPQGSIEEKAKQVIRGVFGNGADRKTALGKEYDAIQAKVNEIYKTW